MEGLKRKHKKFLNGLDSELKNALEYYSRASADINRTLRGHREPTEKIRKLISHIDVIFEAVEPVDTPLTLFRGIDNENYVDDLAFVSTSYDKDVAYAYTEDTCCIIVINVPVGAKVVFIESVSQNKDDKEVLLERGGSFSRTHVGMVSGKKHIYVSYLPPSSSVSKDLPKLVRQSEKEDELAVLIASSVKDQIGELDELGIEYELEDLINQTYKGFTKSQKHPSTALLRLIGTKINS